MADMGNRGFSGSDFGTRTQESAAGSTAGSVKDKAQEFASDVASRAGDAWETTKQTAGNAWDATRQTAQDYASTAQGYASDAMRQAEQAFDSFGSLIRRYPVTALCCAFGLGFLMAGGMQCMMSNRHD